MNDDLDILRRFNLKVRRLEESGFAKRYADDVPNVVAKFEQPRFRRTGDATFEILGRVSSHLSDFDQDEIDAFVLTHRLLTQNNDALSIGSISKIYDKAWMPEEAKVEFDGARTQLNRWLDTPATVQFEECQISVGQLADILIYGGLAHSNKVKAAIFENWTTSGFAGFFWAEFFAYAREMLRYFSFFRDLNVAVMENLVPDAPTNGKSMKAKARSPADEPSSKQ
jgi:hypothetical protein